MNIRNRLAVAVILYWVLAAIAGCGYAKKAAAWPQRGAFVCVTNMTSDPISVAAEDDRGRLLIVIQRIAPSSRFSVRWPFVSNFGRLYAATVRNGQFHTETAFMTTPFNPWSGDNWHWTVALNSFGDKISTGACP